MAGPRVYAAPHSEFLGLKNDRCLSFHAAGGYGAVVMNSSMILGRPFVPGRMVRRSLSHQIIGGGTNMCYPSGCCAGMSIEL